jgi:hypothetical protein
MTGVADRKKSNTDVQTPAIRCAPLPQMNNVLFVEQQMSYALEGFLHRPGR